MMKILMVNKFLYPNGGSETYIFKLGEQLQKKGMRYSISAWNMQGGSWGTVWSVIRRIWISMPAG